MKIDITGHSMGSKVTLDNGEELKNITEIVVTARVDQPSRADISLSFVEVTTVECENPVFHVGEWSGVRYLILDDGDKIELATGKRYAVDK